MPRLAPRYEPTLDIPVCQRVTESQCRSDIYRAWCEEFGVGPAVMRKHWEWVYVMRCLQLSGVLEDWRYRTNAHARGLGFGVGKEPMVRCMAKMGCQVVATDFRAPDWPGWQASTLADLGCEDLAEHVTYVNDVDMRAIPSKLRDGSFDFVWSCCALEHLGSLEAGWDFVRASLECLKPGGVAIHTTEFLVTNGRPHEPHATWAKGGTVVYRPSDVHELLDELQAAGYEFSRHLGPGLGPLDQTHAIQFENDSEPHINVRMALDPLVTTSLGLCIRKPLPAEP